MSRAQGGVGAQRVQAVVWGIAGIAIGLPVAWNGWSELLERRALAAQVERHRAVAAGALAEGQPEQARVALEAAAALAPRDERVAAERLQAHAAVLARRGEQPQIVEAPALIHALRLALARQEGAPGVLRVALGLALAAVGDGAEAERELRAAQRLPGAAAQAGVALGRLLLVRGEVEAAVAVLEQAVAADGANARARLTLGLAFKAQGKWDEAVVALRRSAEQGDEPRAWFELGDTLLRADRPEEALAALGQAERPGARLTGLDLRLGVAAFRSRKLDLALTHLRVAERQGDAGARLNLAIALEAIGDLAGAARLLEVVIEAVPFEPEPYLRLIGVYFALNQEARALALGNRFALRAPLSPALQAQRERVSAALARKAPLRLPPPEGAD